MFNQFLNDDENSEKKFGEKVFANSISHECAIEGYCSTDPIVYSLLEVFLYELKQLTYYYVKMQELGYENKELKNNIYEYLSLILVGYEFNREEFFKILQKIHKEKKDAKNAFILVCEKHNIDCQILKSIIDYGQFEKMDFSLLVKQGEKLAIKRNNATNPSIKNLYEIILNIIKSASIRLIELKSYTDEFIPQENSILKLFNNLNFTTMSEEKLTKKINDFAKVNYEIHKELHKFKEEHYGKIQLNNVLVGPKKGKSILVSGQNLKDFENLLEALKDTDINVYTHNGLVVAHAYPKFIQYKNLVGHFQMSLDSVQFDFATFRGPILIIKNFQYLLDRLYRGRLFTTNIVAGNGMTKIKNDDFSEIISEAQMSKGYINDHKYAEIKVGYDETEIFKKIDFLIEKIKNKDIKHLLIVGLFNHSLLHSEYLEKLEENLPDDYFLISTLVPSNKENVLYFNSFFNSSLIYKIIAYIKDQIDFEKFPVSLFITTCNLHTLSHIFNMKYLGIKNIFLPDCTSNIITPNMVNFLKKQFGFKQSTSNPIKDLETLE